MEAYKFTGTLVYVGEIQKFTGKSGKEFVKRDIAVADDPQEQYPTVLVGTLKKTQKADNTTLVNEKMLNRPCTVEFFPDGRFYDRKTDGRRMAMAGNTIWKIEFPSLPVDLTPETPDEPQMPEPDGNDYPF